MVETLFRAIKLQGNNVDARYFEVLTEVGMKISIFLNVRPWILVKIY
jgi:hypothetical protein